MTDWIVIAYDVVRNRRRSRLFLRLKKVIPRVQKSVFEGPSEPRDLEEARRAIRAEIDPQTDTVRIFHLCPRCRERTELFGVAELVPDEPEDVIVE